MTKLLDKQTKKILAEKLESLIEDKQDIDYKLTIPVQCKQMGVPYQTFKKYLNATSDCSITNLSIIADYYGVSTDYLLGRTNTKSPNTNIQAVCNTVGLSENTVLLLQKWNKSDDKKSLYGGRISAIFENPKFESVLSAIGELLCESRIEGKFQSSNNGIEHIEELQNDQMAKLWIIQKLFTDVIDNMATTEYQKAFEKTKRGADNGGNK